VANIITSDTCGTTFRTVTVGTGWSSRPRKRFQTTACPCWDGEVAVEMLRRGERLDKIVEA
jgi:hypothetical protein